MLHADPERSAIKASDRGRAAFDRYIKWLVGRRRRDYDEVVRAFSETWSAKEAEQRASEMIRTNFSGFVFPDYFCQLDCIIGPDFYEAVFHDGLSFIGGTVRGDVRLNRATIRGSFRVVGTQIFGDLSLLDVEISEYLHLYEATICGRVSLSGAKVAEWCGLGGVNIYGSLDLGAASVEDAIHIADCTIGGAAYFTEAKLVANLEIRASAIRGPLEVISSQLDNPLYIHDSLLAGGLELAHSHFAGRVEIEGCQLGDSRMHGDSDPAGKIASCEFPARFYITNPVLHFPLVISTVDLNTMHFRGVDLRFVSLPALRMQNADFTGCVFPDLPEAFGPLSGSHYKATLDVALFLALQADASGEGLSIPRESSRWTEWPFDKLAKQDAPQEDASPLFPAGEAISHWQPDSQKFWKETWGGAAVSPVQFATLQTQIRELKRSLENAGDPVQAGDFYFTQMEFRRRFHDDGRPRSRLARNLRLLNFYRLLNGYGERPWRCLAWLGFLFSFAAPLYLMNGVTAGELNADGQNYSYRMVNYDLAWRLPHPARLVRDAPPVLEYALRNMLPFVQRNDPALRATGRATRVVAMLQQIAGAVLAAFFFLALRRRFRR